MTNPCGNHGVNQSNNPFGEILTFFQIEKFIFRNGHFFCPFLVLLFSIWKKVEKVHPLHNALISKKWVYFFVTINFLTFQNGPFGFWTFLENGNKWKQMETQKKCPFFDFTSWLTGLRHKSLDVSKSADCIAPFCSFLLLFAPWQIPAGTMGSTNRITLFVKS